MFSRCVRDPELRVKAAVALLILVALGWPASHLLIVVTKPDDLASWTGHLLLGLSWFAILLTALNIIATTDVRKEQDGGEG